MSTATDTTTVHPSRSGAITITKKFHTFIGQWSVHGTRQGEDFGSRFFLDEDGAKAYANELWKTDGVTAQPSLVELASEFTNPAEISHQDWFQATGQSRVAQADLASPRQVKFIRDLLAERDVPASQVEQVTELLGGELTGQQARTWIDALLALPKTTAPAQVEVPAGHYATQSRTGNNDLDFWTVDRPTQGRWAGYTFVSRVIGGHDDQRIRGAEARLALEAIAAAGPEQAARLYGQNIGRCGRCNRHLTDETSRAYGLGPECRSKGW